MIDFPSILAQEDSNLPKIIFGLIFFIIWVLSAVVSWVNKKQQEAKRQRVREELERGARYRQQPPAPPPRPPAPQQRRPAPQRIAEGIAQRFPDVMLPPAPPPMPPQQRRPAPPKPQRAPKQAKPRRPAPAPTLPSLVETAPSKQPYVDITQPLPRAKPPSVDAAAIAKWMTPATLRQQFILTEIFQPPLALRPDPRDPV